MTHTILLWQPERRETSRTWKDFPNVRFFMFPSLFSGTETTEQQPWVLTNAAKHIYACVVRVKQISPFRERKQLLILPSLCLKILSCRSLLPATTSSTSSRPGCRRAGWGSSPCVRLLRLYKTIDVWRQPTPSKQGFVLRRYCSVPNPTVLHTSLQPGVISASLAPLRVRSCFCDKLFANPVVLRVAGDEPAASRHHVRLERPVRVHRHAPGHVCAGAAPGCATRRETRPPPTTTPAYLIVRHVFAPRCSRIRPAHQGLDQAGGARAPQPPSWRQRERAQGHQETIGGNPISSCSFVFGRSLYWLCGGGRRAGRWYFAPAGPGKSGLRQTGTTAAAAG